MTIMSFLKVGGGRRMKVIISPDSFKGTLTAMEAAMAIEQGIKAANPIIETILLPIADGGEGTVDLLVESTKGMKYSVPVLDPLGRLIHASYGVLGDNRTAVIEMAAASGITLLQQDELNPQVATTYGTGQLIKHALNQGFRHFIIGLGGSATNDAGVGMLRALGLRLLNEKGEEVQPSIEGLYDVTSLDFSNWDQRIKDCTFSIASDVNNPLLGEAGATAIFGRQKGVKESEQIFFEKALLNWANVVERQLGFRIHDAVGAGAAGGMGSAFQSFFGGKFHQGVSVILQAMNYSEKIKDAHCIITGEGQSDEQTLLGKAPVGLLACAKQAEIPIVLVSGTISINNQHLLKRYFNEVISIVDKEVSIDLAINDAKNQLQKRVRHEVENGRLKRYMEGS